MIKFGHNSAMKYISWKKKDERTSQLHKIAVLAFISTSGCLGNKIENRKCIQTWCLKLLYILVNPWLATSLTFNLRGEERAWRMKGSEGRKSNCCPIAASSLRLQHSRTLHRDNANRKQTKTCTSLRTDNTKRKGIVSWKLSGLLFVSSFEPERRTVNVHYRHCLFFVCFLFVFNLFWVGLSGFFSY